MSIQRIKRPSQWVIFLILTMLIPSMANASVHPSAPTLTNATQTSDFSLSLPLAAIASQDHAGLLTPEQIVEQLQESGEAAGNIWLSLSDAQQKAILQFIHKDDLQTASDEQLENSMTTLAKTCIGSECNGVDPAATSCAQGARTLSVAYITGTRYRNGRIETYNMGIVELRFSPLCKTDWARVTSWVGSVYHTHINAILEAPLPAGEQRDANNYTVQTWSTMAYAYGTRTRACGTIDIGIYNYICTSWT